MCGPDYDKTGLGERIEPRHASLTLSYDFCSDSSWLHLLCSLSVREETSWDSKSTLLPILKNHKVVFITSATLLS
jgi:hypothetical protein